MARDFMDVEGVEKLINQLNSVHGSMAAKVLRQSLGIAATPIVNKAKELIPKGDDNELHRTYKGNLVFGGFASRSIRKSTRVRKDGVIDVTITTRREAFYAVQFVELGTRKQDAQPWLVPALELKQDAAVYRFGNAVKRKIKTAIK